MTHDFGRMNRRELLAGAAALGASAALPAYAQSVNWRRFAGTTLEVNLIKGPRGDLLQRHADEFTQLTGIKVNSEVIPEQQQRQKIVIELTSGRPSFDVCHISYHVQKRQFERANWLADLNGFLKDPSLTAPDLAESDFSAAGVTYAKTATGALTSLPWSVDYFILYWNKELFDRKNVKYPQSLDELLQAAAQLNDPANGISGFVGRGLRNANMALWGNLFVNYGGEYFNGAGQFNADGPEGVEATRYYQRLLTTTSPAGVQGFNWMESMAAFTQGRAAMWLDGVGWAPPLEDPRASRIAGKVGYGLVPKGPKGEFSATYGDGIAVTRASRNQAAAYLYCQWAVSKTMGARLLQIGGGVPFRNSVLNDAEVRSGVKMPKEWLDSVIGSSRISKLGLPVVIPVTEFRDIYGAAVTATLSGADPAAELKKAADQFRPILERSERA